jgi:hypothetical protein
MQSAFACALLRRDLFQNHEPAHSIATISRSARILKLSWQANRKRLPIQILISAALETCGWNSPTANATDQNHFGDALLLSFGAQLNTNVIQARNHKSRILPDHLPGKFSFRSRTLALRT